MSDMSDFEQWYADNKEKLHLTDRIAAQNVWQAAKQSVQGEAVHKAYYHDATDSPVSIEQWNGLVKKFTNDQRDLKTILAMPKLYTHAPYSVARIAEQAAEIVRLTKELEGARKALQGAKAYFDSDGDISSNSERSIVAAIDASLNIKGGAE